MFLAPKAGADLACVAGTKGRGGGGRGEGEARKSMEKGRERLL